MDIVTLPVGQMAANCYLVSDKETKKSIIIDPGDDADYIQQSLSDNHLVPVQIIATHGHFDHIMGVLELKLAFNIPFFIHLRDEFLVKSMQSGASHFLGINPGPPPPIDGFLKIGYPIKFGSCKLSVIETPGHTPGSLCFYGKEQNILFTGDLLFAGGGVGRTDFAYSDPEMLKESLKKIFKLPGNTVIYPGHGDSSTLQKEKTFH